MTIKREVIALKINTNMSAIIANKELKTTENALSRSLERLSSGLKLNHSEDDAAGMAISQKMKTQLRGIDRANKNAQDGVSVIETAEGALGEIHSMLHRMRELAVQAANDSNSLEDRDSIQEEIDSLMEEIDRISSDTEFNMQSLIDGNLARRAYTDTNGAYVTYMSDNIPSGYYGITVTADAKQAVLEGGALDRGAFAAGVPASLTGSIKLNDAQIEVTEGESLDRLITDLSELCSKTGGTLIGVASTATDASNADTAGYESVNINTASNLVMYSDKYGTGAQMSISCSNPALLSALGFSESVVNGSNVEAEFTDAGGERVGFDAAATITADGREITVKSSSSFEMKFTFAADTTKDGTKEVGIEVTDLGRMVVHIGANEKQQLEIDIPEITTRSLGLEDLNVHTYKLAGEAITAIDAAIETVSVTRSKLGAYQNRLEYAMSNLDVSEENLTSALSRIMDVDMAEEMTEYTQQNVLSQAGISMLSQANARPEMVLQLLQ